MLDVALTARYPGATEGETALRESAISTCTSHLQSGLGDANMAGRLCSSDESIYWQALSEVLAARELQKLGFAPSHAKLGPDFLLEHEGRRIWIEVICPTPAGVPAQWLLWQSGVVQSMPHEAMLLRWTAAIKEKSEKLIGGPGEPETGYLAKGIVAVGDAYVIAVNGRLLRSTFPELEGISQFPFAVEATFSVGPYQVTFDRGTLEATGSGHQHRPRVPKANGARVPADTFLDPRSAPISAIWAMDLDEHALLDRRVPMAIVHNPLATNPVPSGLLPAQWEYVAVSEGELYRLDRLEGRLFVPA